MAYFKVLRPGVLSLIQDFGRPRFMHTGVAQSGALDQWSAHWANKLCGNPNVLPLLEVSMGGLELVASEETTIAITGALLPVRINDAEVPMWQSLTIKSGDTITLGHSSKALRTYLSVRGGFQVEPIFESASTSVREGIGGHAHLENRKAKKWDSDAEQSATAKQGLPLAKGDTLRYHASQANIQLMLPKRWQKWWQEDEELLSEQHIRVIPCAQYSIFPKNIRKALLSQTFTVSNDISRMGYRLSGPQLSHDLPGMLSEATALGAIQLPPSGNPIVLLNDRQTLGGYPKIGAVSPLDCWRLSQMKPADKVQFQLTSVARVHRKMKEVWALMNELPPQNC